MISSTLLSATLLVPIASAAPGGEVDLSQLLEAPARTTEVQANVFTSSTQDRPALAIGPGGDLVVVWQSRRQERGTYGLFAQRFDAVGRPVGGETHINEFMQGMQREPAVAIGADGAAWFAWSSTGQDGSGAAIVARQFDSTLTPLGAEIPVNELRDGDQLSPTLAVNPDGVALVAWQTPRANLHGTSPAIACRLFNRDGDSLTDEIELAFDGDRDLADRFPSVAARDDGSFVLVWSRLDRALDRAEILARTLNANGEWDGPAVRVSPDDATDHIEPAVAMLDGDGLVVVWHAMTDHGYDILARRIGRDGFIDDAPITVARATDAWLSGVAVTGGPDGRFLIAYNADRDGDLDAEVFGQLFLADGTAAFEAPIALNQYKQGRQELTTGSGATRLVWSVHNQLAMAWEGASAEGDESSVSLTLVTPAGLAAATPESMNAERLALEFTEADLARPVPPLWDPDYRTQAPFEGLGDGPDFGFEGVPGTGWYPPDPEMAVGMNHIVLMTNGQINCFLKDGTNLWRDEIENSFGFWGSLGADNFVFDPEAHWDPHSGRFLAMACERSDNGRSNFLLAVSKDGAPETANDWWKYRIDVTSISDNDIDSPNMGVDSDFIYLTADFFGPDKYLVYVIDKSSVLNGGSIVANHELIVGTSQQSMGVPVTYDANAPAQYILQSTELSVNTQVIFHAVTNPISSYQRQTFTLNVPSYTYPNQPPQRGTSSRPFLFEPRFWSCTLINGSLWAVHHVNNQRARVRWYEFDMNNWPNGGTPEIAQWGEIDLGGEIHTFFPSIGVDDEGNAAITFARSAPDEYISMSRAVRLASDAPNTFRDSVIVQDSTAGATGGRWGDYSATVPDPMMDDTFWGHHEFTTSGGTSWRTWVARYDLPNLLDLTVDPLFAGQNASMQASNATPGQRVYFAYSVTGEGSTFVPQLNVTLDLDRPRLGGSAVADGGGVASLSEPIPPNIGPLAIWIQAAEVGRKSNLVLTQIN
ncbi:MAG: hypothetical protein ACF8PN_01680 [Phycisphaerales bacterium]